MELFPPESAANKYLSAAGRYAADRLPGLASRWGLLAVVLIAAPVMLYVGRQTAAEKFQPLEFSDKPFEAAVRSYDGPPLAAKNTPDFVKGIYVSSDTVGNPKRFGQLVDLVKRTELNAMVIDLKNGKGEISFESGDPKLRLLAAAKPPLGKLPELTAPLRAAGIYLIARLPVFQDNNLASKRPQFALKRPDGSLWRGNSGQLWVDPASIDVWKYNVALAKEAYAGGFDEIQFDYIRFPSDGDMAALRYPAYDGRRTKAQVMSDFFTYLDRELRVRTGVPISVDLFGLTYWQHNTDMGIGQRLDSAAPRFDFISPMVYPSHYPPGFEGFANPADHPYEVVHDNLVKGRDLLTQMATRLVSDQGAGAGGIASSRPWIQDFNMGATYDKAKVRAQMKAATDAGASGWLLWNAGNVYTESALEPAS